MKQNKSNKKMKQNKSKTKMKQNKRNIANRYKNQINFFGGRKTRVKC